MATIDIADPRACCYGAQRLTVLAVLLSFLGGFSFGYNTAVIAGIKNLLEEEYGGLTDFELGVATASILLGATISAGVAGGLADKYGRRPVTAASALLCIVGAVLLVFSPDYVWLCVFRVILGLSVGLASVIIPLYVTEVSPAEIRGRMGTVFQLSICFGIVVAYIINYAFCTSQDWEKCYADDKDSWRVQLGLGGVPGVLLVVLVAFLPESTAWTMRRVPSEESIVSSIQSKSKLNVAEADEPSPSTGLLDGQGGLKTQSSTFFDVIKTGKPFTVGVWLAITLQLTGINVILYYAPEIFEKAGFDDAQLIATISVGVWNFLSVIVSLWAVEVYGRRPLLLGGLAAMVVSNVVLALGFEFFEDDIGPTAAVCLAVFIFGFEIGPGPLFFLLVTEIFPARVRGKAVSFMNLLQWVFNLALALSFLTMLNGLGETATFLVMGAMGVASFLVLYPTLPETRGKELDEINF